MRYDVREKQDIPPAAELKSKVLENITAHKEILSQDKRWVGADYEDGSWGDVQRMINNINEEFSL
jgi:hypothetical protein